MKTEKAIERIKAFRDYLCGGNPIWEVDECKEAFDMAIAAMEQRWLPAADVPDTKVGDMISRQAAIDMVEKESQVDGAYGYMDTKSIVDLLESLPSAQTDVPDTKVGKWIPVSERLPKEDTDVLISYRYKEGEGDTSHVYIDITSYGDMYFGGRKVTGAKHWRQPFEYFTSNYEVVAWMPLPEPWRGEEDG